MEYITDLKPGERQYDGIYDLDKDIIVEARYIPSKVAPGNKFIEALPKPWNEEETYNNYTYLINPPSVKELEEMEDYEKELSIDTLMDKVRILLPFHNTIEKQFYSSLVRSYVKRFIIEDVDNSILLNNEEFVAHGIMDVKHMSDPVEGFILLGRSGCGKSTAINTLLSHYPQTIIHDKDTFNRQCQIVYLSVQCTANSNFTKLYENIGDAIDKALGSNNNVYREVFRKHKTLGDKNNLLKDLIKKFCIGCIIFDEIQLMDVKSYKESSLQSFLTLTNETGVVICVVGTMDTYDKILSNERLTRRLGMSIIASKYCDNRNRFALIVNTLTTMQWGENPDEYTKEIIDTLFEVSNGIISDLIAIYKLIQKERCIGTWEGLTPDIIRKKADNYYEILRNTRNKHSFNKNNKLINKAFADLNSALETSDIAKSEQHYDEIMANNNAYIHLKEEVRLGIEKLNLPYSENKINAAFNIIIKEENNETDADKIIAKIVSYLETKKSKKEVKKDAIDLKKIFKEQKATPKKRNLS